MSDLGFGTKVRQAVERNWLKAVRLYTFNTPVSKGKWRLYQTALKMCRYAPTALETKTKDGRKLFVNLTNGMHETVYFLGEYERNLSRIVASMLREGDICVDAGANFGWYTTLFRKNCGASGQVHSFEPVPPTFAELQKNYELLGKPANVFLNNLALGEKQDEIQINVFAGLQNGHASMSTHGRDDFTAYQAQVITLDSYLAERGIKQVNFIKVDVEGAELMLLKGAKGIFNHSYPPPIWLMEMALGTTKSFGYLPNDLITFMKERAVYDFYAVDEVNGVLRRINGFAPDDIGANVICIPQNHHRERTKNIVFA